MERPISKSTVFIHGAARFNDLIYIIAKDRGLIEEEVEHSRFIAFDQLKFAHMGDRNWSSTAICVARTPAEKMVAVGEDGDVFTYVAGTAHDEVIEPRPVMIRSVGVVEGFPVACGMRRQVYRRTGENSWQSMHAPPPDPDQNAGFEAICGFSSDEMYAVGWNGEIWEWIGSEWMDCASPTDLILTGVECADDGQVYACGQGGTLLRGRHQRWELVDLGDFTDDFWDAKWFDRRLYLATMSMLYTYDEAGLSPVLFGAASPGTCYRLTSADGVLWSVGSDDVFAFDGTEWSRVD